MQAGAGGNAPQGAPQGGQWIQEKYCGLITWLVGIFIFPCVCCCPCDDRLVRKWYRCWRSGGPEVRDARSFWYSSSRILCFSLVGVLGRWCCCRCNGCCGTAVVLLHVVGRCLVNTPRAFRCLPMDRPIGRSIDLSCHLAWMS